MTLPTRPDGRIDWDHIGYPTSIDPQYTFLEDGFVFRSVSISTFSRMLATHALERCARWHDVQEKIALECSRRDIATWHRLAAEKFRKMED